MAALALQYGSAPGLHPMVRRDDVISAYFALVVEAAVNLREAREYQDLPRPERLARALQEQRGFLNAFSDPALQAALDLRLLATGLSAEPVRVALLGRAWGQDRAEVSQRAQWLAKQAAAAAPRHVACTLAEDEDAVRQLLCPLPAGQLDAAVITRHELTGRPSRPDAGVPYYFSVVPFTWADTDWTGVYAALAASPVPVMVSAAVRPVSVPPGLAALLADQATLYGRLAREDEHDAGLYFGRRKLAPDSFAVDAAQAYSDLSRRISQRAFALRTCVASAGPLPPGIAETVAAAISPPDPDGGTHLERERAASAYEIRRPATDADLQAVAQNLGEIDFMLLPGRPEIWARPDAPDLRLGLLAVLGDARDASCGFRFPVAVDGTVPGFRVRRGHFGHAETVTGEGPLIRVGQVADSGQQVAVPVSSLTRHALLAGSTGSGKTTTAMELLRQLWHEHRVPFLVIEPVNSDADDYRRLAAEPGFSELEVITAGDEGGRPLRFNPFEVPPGVLVGEHAANLLACFKAAFGLWEPLPSIYTDALSLMYLQAGILASERPGPGDAGRAWPTAVEFTRAMTTVTADLGYAGEVRANIEAASLRRAQQMVRGPAGSVFLTTRPNQIAGLLSHPVILELKSLGTGDEQALMMALLLNAITEHYQAARGASSDLVHVTVVEEAHRLLARSAGGKGAEEAQAKEKAAEAFAATLAENRKYGEGIIIAEQLPTKLVADAVKNTGLKIMHRLTAEDDRRYLGETMGFDEGQFMFATRLRTGEALAYSEDFAQASHIKIIPGLAASSPGPVRPAAAPPFSDCQRCRSQCGYRGAGLAMVRDPAIVKKINGHVSDLRRKGQSRAALDGHWAALIGTLRTHTARFPALPAQDPGAADAAYCLFLHALVTSRSRYHAAWPEQVARRLGISADQDRSAHPPDQPS